MNTETSSTSGMVLRFRALSGPARSVVRWIAIGTSLFHVFILAAYPIDPFELRGIHLCLISVLLFFLKGARKDSPRDRFTITDMVLAGLSVSVLIYLFANFDAYLDRFGVMPERWDMVFATIAVIIVLEMTRRSIGLALPIIAGVFLLYGFFGDLLPGFLRHGGYSYGRIITFLYSTEGIAYIPLGVSATFVFLFILFGAFLSVSGVGTVFADAAMALAGSTRGGPAKVAVISSGLFGMISGVAVANVVTTGTFTIPMMKKIGYKPHFAGAVEATASSGGPIMPPVMGAAAFVMAEMIGVPYSQIIISAIIPAFLFYLAVMLMVDFEAVKQGLVGYPRSQLPKGKELLWAKGHLFIPLAVMIYFIVILQTSVIRAALWSIVSIIAVTMLKRETRLNFPRLGQALYEGAVNIIEVAAACACAGIIIGIMSITGLGVKISTLIIALSGGYLLLALILTMAITILLGMGLPITATYVISAVVTAPALIKMGAPELAAHFFVFYFAVFAIITPPVCVGAFAAAAIAQADQWRVAFTAMKLGFSAYIVPYFFIYGPSLLMIGHWTEILTSTITATVGALCLASSFQGFFFSRPLHTVQRLMLGASAFLLIKPGLTTDFIGGGLFLLVLVWIYRFSSRASV